MIWVYLHYNYFYSYSAVIDFSRQNLTSTDVNLTTKVDPRVETLVMLNCLLLFFIHLKLELLTQFPVTNDEK